MQIPLVTMADLPWQQIHDPHVAESELRSLTEQERILVAEAEKRLADWLRWNLSWDNTPFMNRLDLLDEFRGRGIGRALVDQWEQKMKMQQYDAV